MSGVRNVVMYVRYRVCDDVIGSHRSLMMHLTIDRRLNRRMLMAIDD